MTTKSTTKCITVVLHLPDSPALRNQVTTDLGIGKQFHGAPVTAMSLEDEVSKIEYLEDVCSSEDMAAASRHAAELHEKVVPQA